MTLDQVVRVSIEGAVLAIVVGAICAVFPRLRAGHRALLWWLVSAKLVLGLAPLPALTIEALPAPKAVVASPASAPEGASVLDHAQRDRTPAFASKRAVARWAWIGAASLLFFAMLPAWFRVRGFVRGGRPIDDELSDVIARAARSAGLRRIPRILAVPGLDTPLVTGPLRPAILLPARSLEQCDAVELEMTLAHEMAHIARGDLWLGLVPLLARRIFFFHPAAWIAEREHAIAREAACDEVVLGREGADAFAYGRLLISVATRRGTAAAIPMSRHSMLRRRLLMIDSMLRRAPIGRAGWALVAIVALGMVPVRILAKDAKVASPASEVDASGASRCLDIGSDKSSAYVITNESSHSMCGDLADVELAIKARGEGQDLIWFRVDGQDWIVRDPNTVADAQEIFRQVGEIGQRQGTIGHEQGRIGAQQAQIGMRQGEIGMRQAEIAMKQAAIELDRMKQERGKELAGQDAAAVEAERAAEQAAEKQLAQRKAEIEQLAQGTQDSRSQEDIAKRMRELSERMEVLSRQQQALSEDMSREIVEAQRALTDLIERALRNGTAEKVK